MSGDEEKTTEKRKRVDSDSDSDSVPNTSTRTANKHERRTLYGALVIEYDTKRSKILGLSYNEKAIDTRIRQHIAKKQGVDWDDVSDLSEEYFTDDDYLRIVFTVSFCNLQRGEGFVGFFMTWPGQSLEEELVEWRPESYFKGEGITVETYLKVRTFSVMFCVTV